MIHFISFIAFMISFLWDIDRTKNDDLKKFLYKLTMDFLLDRFRQSLVTVKVHALCLLWRFFPGEVPIPSFYDQLSLSFIITYMPSFNVLTVWVFELSRQMPSWPTNWRKKTLVYLTLHKTVGILYFYNFGTFVRLSIQRCLFLNTK